MKIQTYRMKWAAERYARQIAAKWPNTKPKAVSYQFRWAVHVLSKAGGVERYVYAGTRPRGYGKA